MIIDTINDEEGICKTIKSQYGKTSAANFDRVSTFGASGVVDKTIQKVGQISIYRIRKLTPKECWRLMGYTDEDFEKAAAVNSNTQLYKQAGNAIVKQVLMAIFSQMGIKGIKKWNDKKQEEICRKI
jgi:site-specific DNA-cytosine methylase